MSIVENNMVVNVHIGVWTGQKLDKERSRKLTADANAAEDAARVSKHILSKDAFEGIMSAKTAVYNHFRTNTLPWKDNGDRLLPKDMYHDFVNQHSELKDKFYSAVDNFVSNIYPLARDRAEFRMGDMFNANDYPEPKAIEKKFYVKLNIDSVTTANDFRVALDETDQERVKEAIEADMAARINTAMGNVWHRLGTSLEHFIDRMAPDTKFREATLRNLEELVETIPSLNITNDPNLNAFADVIRQRLTGIDANDLRKDNTLRSQVHSDAAKIMSKMTSFMNAFGDNNE